MIKKTISWLTNFFRLQLFLTCISWPLLLAWGLPLSLLSFAGNLLFTPLLFCFLFISSLIFLTELFSIPNSILIMLLEYTTLFWTWLTSFGTNQALISFATPPLWLSLLIPCAALGIMHHRQLARNIPSIISLLLLFAGTAVLLTTVNNKKPSITQLAEYKSAPYLVYCDEQLILIDSGMRKRHSASWVDYTLLPYLNKNYGKQTLDTLVILNLSKTSLMQAQQLCQKKMVKKILVPTTINQDLKELISYAQQNLIEVIVIEKNFDLLFSDNNYIKLEQENSSLVATVKIAAQELTIGN